MHCREIASFDVLHRALAWPWIAIDPTGTRFAFAADEGRIATRALVGGGVEEGPSFSLPVDLRLPTDATPSRDHRGASQGVHGFALDPRGERVAIVGSAAGKSVLVVVDARGGETRASIEALAGGDFVPHGVTFDRTGARLWISAESGEATALVAVDAASGAPRGVLRSAPFPPPAAHELHPHPQDDAVLLLAACGQDGTFARVARWFEDGPIAIATKLDEGAAPAGFVGFSADGARLHLAEDEALRTHLWPTLDQVSSAPFPDGFMSNYSGAVLGGLIFVDGEMPDEEDREEDAVTIFDRAALKGSLAEPPVPAGMWVGRLGATAVVTVESKGDPARGRAVVLRKLEN